MTVFRGTPVSDGVAAGELYLPDAARSGDGPYLAGGPVLEGDGARADDVSAAFAAVAAERAGLAARLRASGRDGEAGIVEVGALIAADPALSAPAAAAVLAGIPAEAAVRDAAESQAAILEALPDPDLAQRASDVRQVAEAVIARLAGAMPGPPDGSFILVRREVDPADLIRLADGGGLAGAVSVGGGASSHAAIIARGLGLPMLAGADPAVLTAPAGRQAIVDATAGELAVDPLPADLARVAGARRHPLADNSKKRHSGAEAAPGQASTADGELVTVLCNVASAAETRLGLANGAAGVGLLRTEIPFTGARGWPSREEHLAWLGPILGLLAGKRAVVRLLDFSGDKIPPFPGAEGLRAFLAAPGALAAQLEAILAAGAGTDLSVMIPMVRSLDEVRHVRAELARAAKTAGTDPPPLGIMVELAATAAAAASFAEHVDFFSIGTNDLTADVLGRDRVALHPSSASERTVLTAVATVTHAAREAGIGISVCGDAAADPQVLPLLLGVGVRTVSVGAAKVPQVAHWITEVNAAKAAERHAG
jgi:phosphoenolpyruvate-protein kinase (PTS system EI component)